MPKVFAEGAKLSHEIVHVPLDDDFTAHEAKTLRSSGWEAVTEVISKDQGPEELRSVLNRFDSRFDANYQLTHAEAEAARMPDDWDVRTPPPPPPPLAPRIRPRRVAHRRRRR